MTTKIIPIRVRALILLSILVLSSCSEKVAVLSAEVSQDDSNLRLNLGTCNPSSLRIDVDDAGDRVDLAVRARPRRPFGGPDCDHIAIVTLSEPLAGREVFDKATGKPVPVSRSKETWWRDP